MTVRLLTAILAASLALPLAAQAGNRPLAIGEVIPLTPPEGYVFRPVYAQPAYGSRWEPVDTSMNGRPFREPLYTAPRGYVYRTISGYAVYRVAVRPHTASVRPYAVKKKTVRVAARKRGPLCVTDVGYGRWTECR